MIRFFAKPWKIVFNCFKFCFELLQIFSIHIYDLWIVPDIAPDKMHWNFTLIFRLTTAIHVISKIYQTLLWDCQRKGRYVQIFTEKREFFTLTLMINVDGEFIPILVLIHSLHPVARIRVAVLVASNLSKIFSTVCWYHLKSMLHFLSNVCANKNA